MDTHDLNIMENKWDYTNIMRNHDIDGGEIDHIDGDRLNNGNFNLRCVTTQQNQMNRSKMKYGMNKYKGVYYI